VPGRVLLDTNIAIYLATGHSNAIRYLRHLENQIPALSFATAAELLYTSRRAREPERVFSFWLSRFPSYAILFPDLDMCAIWADITAECHRRGRPRQDNDLWIAATALRYHLPLITHNRRDFVDIPRLVVISEASGGD
jgi:tRNA(fMet)-specific endonuclease VapC